MVVRNKFVGPAECVICGKTFLMEKREVFCRHDICSWECQRKLKSRQDKERVLRKSRENP